MLLSSLLVSALFVVSRSADGEGSEAEAVVTLTTESFAAFIEQNENVLVEFYAPWCGHCKALAPEFEAAAQRLAVDESISAKLAKVDATIEKELASKYGVGGFPTLKFFAGGDVEAASDYSGGRTEATIIQWLRTRSMPAVTALGSAEEVAAFRSKGSVVLVAFFGAEGDAAEALAEVADSNRDTVVVGQVSSPEVKFEGTEFGKLYLFRDFGADRMVVHDGELSVEAMAEFVNAERFPLIDAIGPENYEDYVERGLPLVWISLSVDQKDSVVAELLPHAEAAKGLLSFIWVDAEKYEQHVQSLGIVETPGILIANPSSREKFLFEGELNAETLEAFFEGFAAGTLSAHLKSEKVPETNDAAVFVLVGSEFDAVVGHEKDVLVEFYAPWCGHCKRLAPEYEAVGEAFSGVDSVVIAKIDATENDTKEDIQGFPTLLFYPKGETTAVPYEGSRKKDDIIEWLHEHRSRGDAHSDDKAEL